MRLPDPHAHVDHIGLRCLIEARQCWQMSRTGRGAGEAQVYRGRLRSNGQAVAVKVQRPGVREQIAMDVYILRNLLAVVREWRKVNR